VCGGVSGLCQVVGFGGNVSFKLLGSLSNFLLWVQKVCIEFSGAFHTLYFQQVRGVYFSMLTDESKAVTILCFRHSPCTTFQAECVCLCQHPIVRMGP